jgi:hypothetical protein
MLAAFHKFPIAIHSGFAGTGHFVVKAFGLPLNFGNYGDYGNLFL